MSVLAAIQMSSGPDTDENLEVAAGLINKAAAGGATLAVLPENFSLMPIDDTSRIAESEIEGSGPVQDFLSAMAREHGLWLVGGTFPLRQESTKKIRACCMVYDQTGARVSRYDKLHLFDVDLENGESYRESDYIESGNQIVVTDTPVGRLGLSVCYDLRFPEVYRQLSQEGARILSIPSAFTAITGRAHWEILLRSRAIENQAYVIAPAQWGEHASGRRTYGDTMIVGPWGDVLARRFSGIGVVFAEVDDNRLDGIRHHFPSLDHRHL
tara:strand:+ start:4008 stop:4814 length:807 start_codon:yes stop_codon:yes gene_type:complete